MKDRARIPRPKHPKPQFQRDTWINAEEFYTRLEGLTDTILRLPHISGYCYTQLTDVDQEQNGIYNYDHSPKFNMMRIREVFALRPTNWSGL